MFRKIAHLLLAVLLCTTILPVYPSQTDAAGESFVFENLPTAVNAPRISLSGTLSNVSSSGITYTVERMSVDGSSVIQIRDKSSIGVTVSTDGTKLTVTNLELFPGKNRLTFYGKRGSSEVKTVLPIIEYIDSPILYNLAFTGGGQKLQLSETGVTVVPSSFSNNVSQGLFSIEGNAPNAREVIVEYGDNESRNATVREDGTNYFVLNQVKLKKGKNTLKFRIKNDTQNIQVVRDVVYYNDSVTFYDTKLTHTSGRTHNLPLQGNFLVPDTTPANFTVEGQVIVPNDFTSDAAQPMRIEAAYRLAGNGGLGDNNTPDSTDKIIIKFSEEVQNASVMNAAQLQAFLNFYNSGNALINTVLSDTQGTWQSSTINAVQVPNSQLTITIGPNDATNNRLDDVAKIELRQDIIAAKDANKRIEVATAPLYLKQATLAGSFLETSPYVIEAYVQGSAAAGSKRGVDAGEKIIIQLQDSTTSPLPTANQTGYTKTQINNMIQLQTNALPTVDLGDLESVAGSGRYSMLYNGTAKQIEINLESDTGLNTALTSARSQDAGVGSGYATSINLQSFITSAGLNITFQNTIGTNVRLGRSFDADGSTPNPNPDNAALAADSNLARAIYYNNTLTDLGSNVITLEQISGKSYSDSDPYYIFKFKFTGTAFPQQGTTLGYGNQIYLQLQTINKKKTRLAGGSAVYEGTDLAELGYTLVDSTAPYIETMKYNDTVAPTTSFPSTVSGVPVQVSDLANQTTINKMPFAVKLTIPNGNSGAANVDDNEADDPATEEIKVKSTSISGTSAYATLSPTKAYTINGNSREVWFWITDLPFDGTQTLEISYKDSEWTTVTSNTITKTVEITSVSGAAVHFSKLTESMIIRYDPTKLEQEVADEIVGTALQDFKGSLSNVEVNGAADYSGANPKISLTVNNNPVLLKRDGTDPNFIMDDAGNLSDKRKEVRKFFNEGQNTVKFKYLGNGFTYEKSYTVSLFSVNYPEIPKSPNGDIYPYGTDKSKPEKDSRFTGANGIYSTKEAEMNIYGSFDFINMGNSVSEITAKRNSILAGKYILRIEGPNNTTWEWDLKNNQFTDSSNQVYSGTAVGNGLSVVYQRNADTDQQYFTFTLTNQKLPSDGSKAVYNFYVYNDGITGNSISSFRLEVGTSGLPYKVIRPLLPQQATVNQNYVEVVLYAENADKAVVNKVEAEKIDFDGNYDGDTTDSSDYKGAFRAFVKDLKPNKANKITFTITRGSDTISDSFEVFYALANMPGAQYLETMKQSHKIFNGKLTLSFPKDTYLRRVDYSVPENLRTQLFKGHDILFAIANSEDGVVDRYDYINPKPPNFQNLVEELALRFETTYDTHFVKASEVYWIDGGLADNPDTMEYDPYKLGLLPHQLPQHDLPSFDSVPYNRVLVPTARGTLELAYDSNIVSGSSNHITVMRYDPENLLWENLGGQVNASKRTIKVPFDKFGYYVVSKMNDSFQDVIRHPYARNHIEAMYSKGIIRQKRSNEFGTDDETTRAEFTAMVVRALQLPLIEKPQTYSFDDVPTIIDENSLWDYRYIETATRLGLVRGKNPRIFEPNGNITREEAAVILARALQLKQETAAAKVDKDLQKLFKDYNLINSYARSAVLAVAKKKFIVGSPIDPANVKKGYIFEPNANMLRGDAAILISRVMTDLKKIPPVQEVR